ncbi:MAG: DUF2029 domain-containing protein [Maritimibacter sp.]|nr:DUF2029 domain-containing protein [Maritimibacter sp.]
MAILYAADLWRPCLYCDFVAFYAAADLTAQGGVAAIYDMSVMVPQQIGYGVLPEDYGWLPYSYPPPYMFAIFWLPVLPFHLAATLFVAASFALFFVAVRPLLADRDDLIVLLAAPVVWVNAWHGQNAFLTVALAVFACRWLMVRQVRAGLALAVLTVKPHLGLLWPVVLLMKGRWVAIGVALAGALALAGAALALYGAQAWHAFVAQGLAGIHANLVSGDLPIAMVSSPYAWLLLLGVPDPVAMAVHLGAALIAFGVLIQLLRIGTPYRFAMAYLFTATLFVTPHNFPYDWMFVLIGLLIVWQQTRRSGFLPYELAGLIVGYVAPFVIQSLRDVDLPIAAPTLLLVVVIVARRAFYEARRAGRADTAA